MGVSRSRSNLAFTVTVAVIVGVCALPVLLMLVVGAALAPLAAMLAVVAALVPVVPLVACFLWLDRYEPEPRGLLGLALAWGAVVAVVATFLVHGIGGLVFDVSEAHSLALWAPIVEEAAKGAFLFLLLWWRRDTLDGILDGIVYAGMLGIGFAFTENILYLATAYAESESSGMSPVGGLTATFVVRCLFSPFAHPFFTAFIGIGIGIAVMSRQRWVRWLAPLGGYALAVIAHAAWNSSTLIGAGSGVPGFLVVYAVLMLPAFCGMTGLAVWTRISERRLLAASLHDAARRGLVPSTDIGWMVDLRARRYARRYARQRGGPGAERAMRDYQQTVIELGYLHHRYLRGTPPPDFAVRGGEYIARIGAVRPLLAFPGQVVPIR
ncbi:PrsW family intramembrane metalloprotease [Nocardioides insulae]|uniref:PrsW family intramembrane metalloprotease n=1 Tax=Nocardioides insulae TaxID=394734 RepID=UPI0004213F82|nr:PrsW family intramembrane metalloprotease [Nocardioides insulae]